MRNYDQVGVPRALLERLRPLVIEGNNAIIEELNHDKSVEADLDAELELDVALGWRPENPKKKTRKKKHGN